MEQNEIIFLHHGYMPRCTATVDKHFDGYCTLQLMTRGTLELYYDERAYVLRGRWIWPAFPGPQIRFFRAPGQAYWVHRYVAVRGPMVDRWRASGLFPEEPQPAPQGRAWVMQFDALLKQASRTDGWGPARAANLLEGLLLQLAEERPVAHAREPWVERVMARLADPEVFAPDYAEMAAEQGMSLTTFRRRFRAATGNALHRHLEQCRVARARALLGETDLPVKLIAERLGYGDVYYFSRQFREHTGVPPAAYRRSRQK